MQMMNMSTTIRYNWLTKIKFRNSKAEIIVEDKYKLIIILRKNKIVVKYNDDSIVIGFTKFSTEEIAKKIYSLVEKIGEFDIEVIKEVLQSLRLGYLSGRLTEKILRMSYEEGDKVMEQFEKFINKIR